MFASGEGFGGMGGKGEGVSSTNCQLQDSRKDVKHSMGNIVSSVVITVYGARCVLGLSGESLHNLYI